MEGAASGKYKNIHNTRDTIHTLMDEHGVPATEEFSSVFINFVAMNDDEIVRARESCLESRKTVHCIWCPCTICL